MMVTDWSRRSALALILAVLAGCASTPGPGHAPVATPAPVTSVTSEPATAVTATELTAEQEAAALAAGWPAFREQLREQSLAAGISAATVESVFADLQFTPHVVKQDRNQPHKKLRHEDYLQKVITNDKIERARSRYREHAELLTALEQQYGVEGKFLVALWGVESNFGRLMGKHHVPSALATMAYEGRRREFFSKEFLAALTIIDNGDISNDAMRGSWAGAMGQCQFMPSSYLNFAADGDGDGRKDIWGNTADVLASIANYLHKNGWRRDETWGRQVQLVQELGLTPAQLREARSLTEWQTLGVRRDTGADLPARDLKARLLLPDDPSERTYLIYNNYDVLLRWNRSKHFATSVGYLAERIQFPPLDAEPSVQPAPASAPDVPVSTPAAAPVTTPTSSVETTSPSLPSLAPTVATEPAAVDAAPVSVPAPKG